MTKSTKSNSASSIARSVLWLQQGAVRLCGVSYENCWRPFLKGNQGVTTLRFYLERKLKLISRFFFPLLIRRETWVKCVMCNMHLRLDLSCVTTSASLMYVTELIVVKCLTENNHKFRAWLLFIVHGYHTKNWRSYNGKNPPDIQRGSYLIHGSITPPSIRKSNNTRPIMTPSFFNRQGVPCNVFKAPCRVLLVNLLLFIAEITLLRK